MQGGNNGMEAMTESILAEPSLDEIVRRLIVALQPERIYLYERDGI